MAEGFFFLFASNTGCLSSETITTFTGVLLMFGLPSSMFPAVHIPSYGRGIRHSLLVRGRKFWAIKLLNQYKLDIFEAHFVP